MLKLLKRLTRLKPNWQPNWQQTVKPILTYYYWKFSETDCVPAVLMTHFGGQLLIVNDPVIEQWPVTLCAQWYLLFITWPQWLTLLLLWLVPRTKTPTLLKVLREIPDRRKWWNYWKTTILTMAMTMTNGLYWKADEEWNWKYQYY